MEDFHKIVLQTQVGDHVVDAEMRPKFTPPPLVVKWGERVFHLHATSVNDGSSELIYREVFSYVLVPIPGEKSVEAEQSGGFGVGG